jgi:hypothetical protein
LHDLIAHFGIASVADRDLGSRLIGKTRSPSFGEAPVLCVVNQYGFGLRDSPFSAALEDDHKDRTRQQRSDGTAANCFHLSLSTNASFLASEDALYEEARDKGHVGRRAPCQ